MMLPVLDLHCPSALNTYVLYQGPPGVRKGMDTSSSGTTSTHFTSEVLIVPSGFNSSIWHIPGANSKSPTIIATINIIQRDKRARDHGQQLDRGCMDDHIPKPKQRQGQR